jgi:hypothetical protein
LSHKLTLPSIGCDNKMTTASRVSIKPFLPRLTAIHASRKNIRLNKPRRRVCGLLAKACPRTMNS